MCVGFTYNWCLCLYSRVRCAVVLLVGSLGSFRFLCCPGFWRDASRALCAPSSPEIPTPRASMRFPATHPLTAGDSVAHVVGLSCVCDTRMGGRLLDNFLTHVCEQARHQKPAIKDETLKYVSATWTPYVNRLINRS